MPVFTTNTCMSMVSITWKDMNISYLSWIVNWPKKHRKKDCSGDFIHTKLLEFSDIFGTGNGLLDSDEEENGTKRILILKIHCSRGCPRHWVTARFRRLQQEPGIRCLVMSATCLPCSPSAANSRLYCLGGRTLSTDSFSTVSWHWHCKVVLQQ